MPEKYKVGLDCKSYYSTAGIGDTPTFVEFKIVKEVSLDLSADEAEVNDRSSIWTKFLAGKLKAPLTLTISRKIGNPGYIAFRNAFLARGTIIGLALASGTMTDIGEELFMADFIVTAFPITEAISDANEVEITLQLAANSDNEPSFADVSA